jgi:probable selenate reductase FAD-binding subunit
MIIKEYHRPATLEEALALVNREQVATVPLGGGTVLNGLPRVVPEAVVDLQALGLDGISSEEGMLQIGAMATLQDLVEDPSMPSLLAELAHREAPNTLRNAATIGGTVAAGDPESGLLAGLLASAADVIILTLTGEHSVPLDEILSNRSRLDGGIITLVTVPSSGIGASQGTSRTPADTPIVLVAGRIDGDGNKRFAATGIDSKPVVVNPEDLGDIEPRGDFRGSSGYRKHLLAVLLARVSEELDTRDGA